MAQTLKAIPTVNEMQEKGFRAAIFTKKWLEQNPKDAGKEIYAKDFKKPREFTLLVWKRGQKSVSVYSKDFVNILFT